MHFKHLPAWAKVICLLAVAFVVTWGFWMALRETLCGIDAKDFLLKRPTRGACFEFWLNRYQTTFQTAVASSLTIAGLYFVIRQLTELTNQNRMTAAALEGTRREQAANRRIVIARAMGGVDRYSGVVGVLMLEVVRQMATKLPPLKADEIPGMGNLREADAEVYPALTTGALRDQWKAIKREYVACIAFILTNGLPNASEAYKRQYAEINAIPTTHEEALKRVASLSGNLKWIARELEANTPDD